MWTACRPRVSPCNALPCSAGNRGCLPRGQNWEVNLVLTHDPELSKPPGLELEGFMEPSLPSCCKVTGLR